MMASKRYLKRNKLKLHGSRLPRGTGQNKETEETGAMTRLSETVRQKTTNS
jgi:hypothetical protein